MKHRKHITAGLTASLALVILFSIYTVMHRQPKNTTITTMTQRISRESETPHVASRRAYFQSSTFPRESTALQHFQKTDFYRTIIDNNLFRPLGWIPPRPQEPYRLLGTIIPTNAKSPPKAIIQNTVGNQTHIITIGDTLDTDTLVTDIQTKHVTLKKNGQPRQLTLKSSFLQRR